MIRLELTYQDNFYTEVTLHGQRELPSVPFARQLINASKTF